MKETIACKNNKTGSQSKLICFLYLLMRDELPCGVVAKIIQKIKSSKKEYFIFSNDYLAKYAKKLAEDFFNI